MVDTSDLSSDGLKVRVGSSPTRGTNKNINKMDNKTRIKFTRNCIRYKVGDTGYIDAYLMGTDSVPCAIVVKDSDNKFVIASLHNIVKI